MIVNKFDSYSKFIKYSTTISHFLYWFYEYLFVTHIAISWNAEFWKNSSNRVKDSKRKLDKFSLFSISWKINEKKTWTIQNRTILRL